ncbi:hypothetical protein THRCLA_05477 [Thraustotheca clavata]|uniref:PX domain-containing protein n=1 Tax=Thraustotheca clavata TaxID=74557 RepID=A0A1V9ZVT8_9STRA|nr:hypothetical protein THRCLA_05477 [Thraustotheca clavata]
MLLLSQCACQEDCSSPRRSVLSNPVSPSRDFGYQTLNLEAKASSALQTQRINELAWIHKRSSTGTSPYWLDIDMNTLPDGQRGPCENFCLPQNWSAAFASPQDFTIKAYEAKANVYTLAVLSLAVPKASPTEEIPAEKPKFTIPTYANHYNKPPRQRLYDLHHSSSSNSWSNPWAKTNKVQHVAFVQKTENEIKTFVHSMALRLPGHNLATNFKRKLKQSTNMETRAEAIIDVLAYILCVTHVGHEFLVPLREPIVQDIRVRMFFQLAWGSALGPSPSGSNSCDGRLESQERPSLPLEWTNDVIKTSSSQSSFVSRSKQNTIVYVPKPQCTNYVKPQEWERRHPKPGAFTVQLTNIYVGQDGVAHYTLTVLYQDQTEKSSQITVSHRYNEFFELATHLQKKTGLSIMSMLPPKTFFASSDVLFLEYRSIRLQQFIHNMLALSFTGMLDQTISMVAEPQVRLFLKLPIVQWNVIPVGPVLRQPVAALDRFRAFSNSPTLSSHSSSSPMKLMDQEDSKDDEDDDTPFVACETHSETPYYMPRRTSQRRPMARAGAA